MSFRITRTADGGLEVSGEGLWTPAAVEAHLETFATEVGRIRAAGRRLRLLIDLRAALVQPREVVALLEACTDRLYGAGDWVALVASGALLRLQIGRTSSRADRRVFADIDEARYWLGEAPPG